MHISTIISFQSSPLVLLHNTLHSQADFVKKLTQTISWTDFVLTNIQTWNQWAMIIGWKKSSSGNVQCLCRGKAKQYTECALWREAQIRILILILRVIRTWAKYLTSQVTVGFGVWKHRIWPRRDTWYTAVAPGLYGTFPWATLTVAVSETWNLILHVHVQRLLHRLMKWQGRKQKTYSYQPWKGDESPDSCEEWLSLTKLTV